MVWVSPVPTPGLQLLGSVLGSGSVAPQKGSGNGRGFGTINGKGDEFSPVFHCPDRDTEAQEA